MRKRYTAHQHIIDLQVSPDVEDAAAVDDDLAAVAEVVGHALVPVLEVVAAVLEPVVLDLQRQQSLYCTMDCW